MGMALLFFPMSTAKGQKGKPAPKNKYNTIPVDETVNEVVPDDPGHDPAEVFRAILRIQTSIKPKDEFETTKQYESRFRAAFEKPIYGLLTVEDLFAFRINTAWFRYDADEGLFHGFIFYQNVYPLRSNALCINYTGSGKNPNRLVFLDVENPEKLKLFMSRMRQHG